MAAIPKKVSERFVKNIRKYQKILQMAKDHDVNESDTVAILNDVFGDIFGYDKYVEVTSELAIRGTYCDLAIRVDEKVQFLVEVKAIGTDLKDSHMKQACDYGANHGVPWVVLTNGIEWKLYRIRFEQPISFDLVCSFDFLAINSKNEKDQEILFMLAKEGLIKNTREDYFEKVQSVNRYIIGNLILTEPVSTLICRELKKLSGGMKIDSDEVDGIIRSQVLKREVVEGDEAGEASKRVQKFYRKNSLARKPKNTKSVYMGSGSAPANETLTECLPSKVSLHEENE